MTYQNIIWEYVDRGELGGHCRYINQTPTSFKEVSAPHGRMHRKFTLSILGL